MRLIVDQDHVGSNPIGQPLVDNDMEIADMW